MPSGERVALHPGVLLLHPGTAQHPPDGLPGPAPPSLGPDSVLLPNQLKTLRAETLPQDHGSNSHQWEYIQPVGRSADLKLSASTSG